VTLIERFSERSQTCDSHQLNGWFRLEETGTALHKIRLLFA
jgi:hypothetical protein